MGSTSFEGHLQFGHFAQQQPQVASLNDDDYGFCDARVVSSLFSYSAQFVFIYMEVVSNFIVSIVPI